MFRIIDIFCTAIVLTTVVDVATAGRNRKPRQHRNRKPVNPTSFMPSVAKPEPTPTPPPKAKAPAPKSQTDDGKFGRTVGFELEWTGTTLEVLEPAGGYSSIADGHCGKIEEGSRKAFCLSFQKGWWKTDEATEKFEEHQKQTETQYNNLWYQYDYSTDPQHRKLLGPQIGRLEKEKIELDTIAHIDDEFDRAKREFKNDADVWAYQVAGNAAWPIFESSGVSKQNTDFHLVELTADNVQYNSSSPNRGGILEYKVGPFLSNQTDRIVSGFLMTMFLQKAISDTMGDLDSKMSLSTLSSKLTNQTDDNLFKKIVSQALTDLKSNRKYQNLAEIFAKDYPSFSTNGGMELYAPLKQLRNKTALNAIELTKDMNNNGAVQRVDGSIYYENFGIQTSMGIECDALTKNPTDILNLFHDPSQECEKWGEKNCKHDVTLRAAYESTTGRPLYSWIQKLVEKLRAEETQEEELDYSKENFYAALIGLMWKSLHGDYSEDIQTPYYFPTESKGAGKRKHLFEKFDQLDTDEEKDIAWQYCVAQDHWTKSSNVEDFTSTVVDDLGKFQKWKTSIPNGKPLTGFPSRMATLKREMAKYRQRCPEKSDSTTRANVCGSQSNLLPIIIRAYKQTNRLDEKALHEKIVSKNMQCSSHFRNYVENKSTWGMKMRFQMKDLLQKPFTNIINKISESNDSDGEAYVTAFRSLKKFENELRNALEKANSLINKKEWKSWDPKTGYPTGLDAQDKTLWLAPHPLVSYTPMIGGKNYNKTITAPNDKQLTTAIEEVAVELLEKAKDTSLKLQHTLLHLMDDDTVSSLMKVSANQARKTALNKIEDYYYQGEIKNARNEPIKKLQEDVFRVLIGKYHEISEEVDAKGSGAQTSGQAKPIKPNCDPKTGRCYCVFEGRGPTLETLSSKADDSYNSTACKNYMTYRSDNTRYLFACVENLSKAANELSAK